MGVKILLTDLVFAVLGVKWEERFEKLHFLLKCLCKPAQTKSTGEKSTTTENR